jgi:glycogen synthase
MASAVSAHRDRVHAAAQDSPAHRAPSSILYVTPEIADFVKAGGLGDVSAALPRALRGRCDVRVLLPGYRQVLQRCPALEVLGRHTPVRYFESQDVRRPSRLCRACSEPL